MANPTSRQGLVDYCLRRLGSPVIEINVDPDQLEDRVDEALQVYQEYHGDGTFRSFERIQVTSTDLSNGYVTIPSDIVYVTRIFPITGNTVQKSFFDIKYQLHLNDITNMQSYMGDLAYYEQIQQYLSLIDMQLNGTPQIDYARKQDRIYVHGDFVDNDVQAGDYLIVECYKAVNPATFTKIYNDKWVKEYTTALIKMQWGSNLIKFEGMQLPGGVMLNGRQLFDDAMAEIERLREDIRLSGEYPVDFFVG